MAISFTCTCGKRLKVADTLVGKKVKCPDCQKVTLVTADGAAAPAKPAAKPGVPPAKPPVAPAKPAAAARPAAAGKPAPPPAKSKPTVPAGKAAPEPDLSSYMEDDEAPRPAVKKKPRPVDEEEEPQDEEPNFFSDEEEATAPPKKKAKPAADEDEPDLSNLFGDENGDEVPSAAKKKPRPADDDEDLPDVSSLLDDEEEEAPKPKKKAKPPVDEEEEPDLSSMMDEDIEAPAPKKKGKPAIDEEENGDLSTEMDEDEEAPKPKKKGKPAADEDEEVDLDSMLDEVDSALAKTAKKKPAKLDEDEDVPGLDEEDEPPPPVKAKKGKKPVIEEDEDEETPEEDEDAPKGKGAKKKTSPPGDKKKSSKMLMIVILAAVVVVGGLAAAYLFDLHLLIFPADKKSPVKPGTPGGPLPGATPIKMDWFEDKDGNFKVLVPTGKMAKTDKDGLISFTVAAPPLTFKVGYAVADESDADAQLTKFLEKEKAVGKGEKIKLGKGEFPGQSFEAADKKPRRGIVYAVKDKLYELSVSGPAADKLKTEDAEKFLKSFTLLKEPEGTDEPKAAEWKKLTPKGAGFLVEMPANAAQDKKDKKSLAFTASDKDNKYFVKVMDAPPDADPEDAEGLKKLWDAERDKWKKALKAKGDPMEEDIKLDEKYPGREVKIATDKLHYRFRVYLVDKKMFVLSVIGSEESIASEDAEKFFKSLKLTLPAPQEGKNGERQLREFVWAAPTVVCAKD